MSAQDTIDAVLQLCGDTSCEELLPHLRALRNLCARGPENQLAVVEHNTFCGFLQRVLFSSEDASSSQLYTVTLQLLANSIVNNAQAQQTVWQRFGACIAQRCAAAPLGRHTDILLMIVHNVFHGPSGVLSDQQALHIAVTVWQALHAEKCDTNLEFLHFLFEHFVVRGGRNTVRCYSKLSASERIAFLDYVASYLRNDSPNGLVHSFLLQHIAKEFKMRSDCVLRQAANTLQQDPLQPREAYALLRVIASATGSEMYATLYTSDHALFLNVSSLLRCLVTASQAASPNQFTPMNKLEEVALSSKIAYEFESEVSFELKTLLVRCTANLLYQNATNQNYCQDTQLMPTLFECTNMDARNPLMKEWSILAIRNACAGCPANQEVISKLTKQADAPSERLNELNLEMGSLRIKPTTE